jgi:hypothetical protein
MRYVTSVVVGVVAALVASVLWVMVVLVLPILVPFLLSRVTNQGSGGAGASVGSGSILAAASVGFLLGFLWMLRRPAAIGRPSR